MSRARLRRKSCQQIRQDLIKHSYLLLQPDIIPLFTVSNELWVFGAVSIIYKSIISTATALNVRTKLPYGSPSLSAKISATSLTVTDSAIMEIAAATRLAK